MDKLSLGFTCGTLQATQETAICIMSPMDLDANLHR